MFLYFVPKYLIKQNCWCIVILSIYKTHLYLVDKRVRLHCILQENNMVILLCFYCSFYVALQIAIPNITNAIYYNAHQNPNKMYKI